LANLDQVLLEAGNRVAQREVAPVVGGAVFGWVIGGGVRAGAIGDPLDQRWPQVAPCAFGSPGRGGIHRDKVIAVYPQGGDAAAHAASGEGGGFTAGDGLEGGDGPLIIDHVEYHRRAVDVGEGEGGVEV